MPSLDKKRVETLLIELSARFIGLPADRVDTEIHEAQRRICEHLDLDRSSLWQQPAEEDPAFVMTHVYQRACMPEPPPKPDARFLFPWVLEQLQQKKTVALGSLDDLPAEAARDKEMLLEVGTASVLIVPLSIGKETLGALTFASARERDRWPQELVQRLRLVAEVFGNAIARARGDRLLRENEQRLRAVIDTAVDGIVTIDERGTIESTNPAAVQIFGYEPGELIGRSVSMLMPPPYSAEHDAHIADYLTTGKKTIIGIGREVIGLRKNGSTLPIDLAVSETELDDGRRIFTGIVRDITERKQAEEELGRTLEELEDLRDRLRQQNVELSQEVRLLRGQVPLVGQSPGLKRVLAQVEQVASTGSTVLLLGETGTGKELIATAIHDQSPRHERPMVRVNCSAIPAELVESELFGREKGAYTGALSRQVGRFELASGSTLFLDEIGELPLAVQVKLLRVLEDGHVERLGSPTPVPIDVRIITATNVDLDKAVRDGRFRSDLFYRLNVFPITLPPLRERPGDILPLVNAFVQEFAEAFRKRIDSIAGESLTALQRYDWPGNVRELRNLVERAMILAQGPELRIEVPSGESVSSSRSLLLNQLECDHIRHVLELTDWRVRGKAGAAELLGLKPTTLESRMARLGIDRHTRR